MFTREMHLLAALKTQLEAEATFGGTDPETREQYTNIRARAIRLGAAADLPTVHDVLTARREELRAVWSPVVDDLRGQEPLRLPSINVEAARTTAARLGAMEKAYYRATAWMEPCRVAARLGDHDSAIILKAHINPGERFDMDELLNLRAVVAGGWGSLLHSGADWLGDLERMAGNREGAKKAYRLSIEIGLGLPATYSMVSLADMEVEDHHWTEARRLYRLVLDTYDTFDDTDPNCGYNASRGLATIELLHGRPKKALHVLLEWLGNPAYLPVPDNPEQAAYFALGDLAYDLGLNRPAFHGYFQAAQMGGALAEIAEYNLALVSDLQGYPDSALGGLASLLDVDNEHLPDDLAQLVAHLAKRVAETPWTGPMSRDEKTPHYGRWHGNVLYPMRMGRIMSAIWEGTPIQDCPWIVSAEDAEFWRTISPKLTVIKQRSEELLDDPDLPDDLRGGIAKNPSRLIDTLDMEFGVVWENPYDPETDPDYEEDDDA